MHPCDICSRWDASVYYLLKDSQIRSSQPQGMAPDTGRRGREWGGCFFGKNPLPLSSSTHIGSYIVISSSGPCSLLFSFKKNK